MVFSFDPFSKVTVASLEHLMNAAASIVSTLAGISIEVRAVQSEKAP